MCWEIANGLVSLLDVTHRERPFGFDHVSVLGSCIIVPNWILVYRNFTTLLRYLDEGDRAAYRPTGGRRRGALPLRVMRERVPILHWAPPRPIVVHRGISP